MADAAHRRAPAFLALRRRRVRLDRRLDGAAAAGFPAAGCCAARCARAGFDALRSRCRRARPRGDALAARARRRPSLHRRRRRLGRPAGGRPRCSSSKRSPPHPKLVGMRHVVQAEPDDFLHGRRFRRGIAAARALRARLRHPRIRAAAPAARSSSPRLPAAAASSSIISASRTSGRRRSTRWRRGSRSARRLPNVFAKLSGLVTEADWRGWTPAALRPYVDAALDAFGADRLMIGSDWPVCTVAGTYARCDGCRGRRRSRGERLANVSAVLGGTARRFWNLSV